MKQWSRKFNKCIKCNTIEKKHHARGLCRRCYYKEYEQTQEYKEYRKEYRNKYEREKRKADPIFRLNDNIGRLMRHSLKGQKDGRKWKDLVGYSIKELMNHLENLFDNKMSWDNYGSYWEVDHIKPRSLFRYKTPEDIEFKECWALKNLQPLEAVMNHIKSNNFPK